MKKGTRYVLSNDVSAPFEYGGEGGGDGEGGEGGCGGSLEIRDCDAFCDWFKGWVVVIVIEW